MFFRIGRFVIFSELSVYFLGKKGNLFGKLREIGLYLSDKLKKKKLWLIREL